MLILANGLLSESDKNFLIRDSDVRFYYVFGLNMDNRLIELIPYCDDFNKWSSLCHDCFLSGSFVDFGKILCRRCRNVRRESARKFDATRIEKEKKRVREADSDDRALCKKALNLSINSSEDSIQTDNEIEN